ncbi:hypothetical protein T10_13429 [Trichinella papuae]|uniref:Uncharacterized protein n=1 Tax=Trichinella papuae TaxID=268474 RepID=A0A0V1MM10_9BILA|nr:hypothetical protein T10_13429 [Trichinella papuae]
MRNLIGQFLSLVRPKNLRGLLFIPSFFRLSSFACAALNLRRQRSSTNVSAGLNEKQTSKSCLPENACKFLFDWKAFAYVALILIVVGVQCAMQVHWRYSIETSIENGTKKK